MLPATLLQGQDTLDKVSFLSMQGYIKDLQGIYFVRNMKELTSSNLLHNRINTRFTISSSLAIQFELRNRIFWGDQLKTIPGFGTYIDQYSGLIRLSKLWVDEPDIVIHSVIDRFVGQYAHGQWDIRVGRQRINWGINTIWNPNDIFNAFNFLDFDYEERPGNDAVRIQRYFNTTTSAEIAWKPGKERNENIAALLYRFNTSRYDVQLLGGVYLTDWVIGGGWAGNIKEAGFKGELSYFHPRENFSDTSGTLSFSIMADQTFKNEWYISVSFLYLNKPAGTTGGNTILLSEALSAKQLFPYRYTFYAGVMKAFTPISSMNVSVIYSPTNTSLIFFPSFTYNASNNLDLSLILQSYFASYPTSFSSRGHAVYLRTKWSF